MLSNVIKRLKTKTQRNVDTVSDWFINIYIKPVITIEPINNKTIPQSNFFSFFGKFELNNTRRTIRGKVTIAAPWFPTAK